MHQLLNLAVAMKAQDYDTVTASTGLSICNNPGSSPSYSLPPTPLTPTPSPVHHMLIHCFDLTLLTAIVSCPNIIRIDQSLHAHSHKPIESAGFGCFSRVCTPSCLRR